ncbi:MAG: DUF2784 domain-containing protein [Acidobacteriota bacterium]
MLYRLAADSVVAFHFAFVLFVVLGGLLTWRWPRAAWLHLPAAAWGFLVEATGWFCPLTDIENHLRARAGQAGYDGGFIEHYILPVLYPVGLTRADQHLLAAIVLVVNAAVYGRLWWRRRTERSGPSD